MRKNVYFYLIAFTLLLLNLLFFIGQYQKLIRHNELINRTNKVRSSFQNLSRQIKTAAVLTPELLPTNHSSKAEQLFRIDKGVILKQLDLLQQASGDSINQQIAAALETKIRAELSWIIESNVPDSIIHHRSPAHVAAVVSIDSLIEKGIQRTVFLQEDQERTLSQTTNSMRTWMFLFIILSGILLIYTTISLFWQQSQRKRKEEELMMVFNRISDGVVSVDNSWRYTFLNDAAMSTHPQSKEETIGQVIWDVHPEMKGTIFWDKYHEAMETGKVVEVENYYPPMDIWFSVKVYPSPNGLTIFYRNVTENKRAERDILHLNAELDQKVLERTHELSEAKNQLSQTLERVTFLASIADNIHDPVIVTDNNSIITRWNKAAEKLLEWTSEEVIGRNSEEILKGSYPDQDRTHILQYLKDDHFWKGEIIYHTKSGRPVNVLATASDLKDARGNMIGYLVLVRDISIRIKAEAKLKEFEHFFNNSNDLSCIANKQGYFEILNPSFNKLLGYSGNELAERPFIDFIHPDDIPATLSEYEKLKSGAHVIHFLNRYRKKDGSYLWLDWNASSNPETGKLYCIARDITDSKKADDALNKLNEELEAFSYSVSHDLRAPLRGIMGFSTILEEDYNNKLDDEGRRVIAVIKRNTLKMGKLIDDLLAFSRLGKQGIVKVLINSKKMVDEIVIELLPQHNKQHAISWDIHELLPVKGDRNTVHQVWINLISNAIKYSRKKEKPHIEIGSYNKDGEVSFYIKDNGCGFDEAYKDKLFKVFQRLHDADEFEGTGVGLAIVEKIISRHGGRVWAEGKENEGACFHFSLPASN